MRCMRPLCLTDSGRFAVKCRLQRVGQSTTPWFRQICDRFRNDRLAVYADFDSIRYRRAKIYHGNESVIVRDFLDLLDRFGSTGDNHLTGMFREQNRSHGVIWKAPGQRNANSNLLGETTLSQSNGNATVRNIARGMQQSFIRQFRETLVQFCFFDQCNPGGRPHSSPRIVLAYSEEPNSCNSLSPPTPAGRVSSSTASPTF